MYLGAIRDKEDHQKMHVQLSVHMCNLTRIWMPQTRKTLFSAYNLDHDQGDQPGTSSDHLSMDGKMFDPYEYH